MLSTDLQAMSQRLVAQFMQGVPHFQPPQPLPDLLTSHDFETRIKGVLVTVAYNTKEDRLDGTHEIDYGSFKIFHADEDVSDWFPDSKSTGTCLRHEVEADWLRICEESREDWQ